LTSTEVHARNTTEQVATDVLDELLVVQKGKQMSAEQLLEKGILTLSIKETADLLNVNPRLVSKECTSGVIPSVTLGRRRLVLLRPLVELLTGKELNFHG